MGMIFVLLLSHHVDGMAYDLSCDGKGMVKYFPGDGMGWYIIFRVMGWNGASFSYDGAGRWDGRAFASSWCEKIVPLKSASSE